METLGVFLGVGMQIIFRLEVLGVATQMRHTVGFPSFKRARNKS
jgi:hypothetical protein